MGPLIGALMLLACLLGAALAQEERRELRALFGGRAVLVERSGDAGVRIVYDQPDKQLILSGAWQEPPRGVLEGSALARRDGCADVEYPVRGVVDAAGALMVFGHEPQLNAACEQEGAIFMTLRFTVPPPAEARVKVKARRKERPRAEGKRARARAKPKERPTSWAKQRVRQRPRSMPAVPSPHYRYQPQWQPWQGWRYY